MSNQASSEQDQSLWAKAAAWARDKGGVAGQAIGSALGLGDVMSKPAGSMERAHAAQEQLRGAAGVVPGGEWAADKLIAKVNDTYGPKGGTVTEGDDFKVEGASVSAPGAGVGADGSIRAADGTTVDGEGKVSSD